MHAQAMHTAAAVTSCISILGVGSLAVWHALPHLRVTNTCVCLQVLAVAINSGFVTFPKSYQRIPTANGLAIWQPEAPQGYTALGCLATAGEAQPGLTDMACVHASVCVESHLGQCLSVQSVDTQIWCVDNVGATWLTSAPSEEPSAGARA